MSLEAYSKLSAMIYSSQEQLYETYWEYLEGMHKQGYKVRTEYETVYEPKLATTLQHLESKQILKVEQIQNIEQKQKLDQKQKQRLEVIQVTQSKQLQKLAPIQILTAKSKLAQTRKIKARPAFNTAPRPGAKASTATNTKTNNRPGTRHQARGRN